MDCAARLLPQGLHQEAQLGCRNRCCIMGDAISRKAKSTGVERTLVLRQPSQQKSQRSWMRLRYVFLSHTGLAPAANTLGKKGSSGLQRKVTLHVPKLTVTKPYCHCTGCWHHRPGSAPLSYSLGERRDAAQQEQHPEHPAGSRPRKGWAARPKGTSAALITEQPPAPGALASQ